MLNLYKRGDSDIYWMRFAWNGTQVKRSTKTTELALARRILAQARHDAVAGTLDTQPTRVTVAQWLDRDPLRSATKRASSVTRDSWSLAYLRKNWGDRVMLDIRRSDCEALLAERGQTVSFGTLERDRVIFKSVFQRAVADKLLVDNPFGGIKGYGRLVVPRDRVLSRDDETALRAVLAPEWQRFLIVALSTGLRLGELLTLRPNDIHDGAIHVRGDVTKSGKPRVIGVRPEVADALFQQAAPQDLHSTARYWSVDERRVREALQAGCKAANVVTVTPHALRHTFASRAAIAGMPLIQLQRILGHSSVEITAKYYVHIEENVRVDALLRLDL